MRILLVEDDTLLGDGICVGLRQESHAVDWVQNAEHAAAMLAIEEFDLMILDIGLPGKNGFTLLREIRAAHRSLPVIILTARDALQDRIQGLDLGADDYVLKPFDLEELCARARAVSRRSQGRAAALLHAGKLQLDPAAHRVTCDGGEIELPRKEFALLRVLMENKGRVVTKSRLQNSLYSWSDEVESNALEVHIHNLRRKIGAEKIRTVRGVGYVLPEDDEG